MFTKVLQVFKFTFMSTFYARKLKFGMLLTQALTFSSVLRLPLVTWVGLRGEQGYDCTLDTCLFNMSSFYIIYILLFGYE